MADRLSASAKVDPNRRKDNDAVVVVVADDAVAVAGDVVVDGGLEVDNDDRAMSVECFATFSSDRRRLGDCPFVRRMTDKSKPLPPQLQTPNLRRRMSAIRRGNAGTQWRRKLGRLVTPRRRKGKRTGRRRRRRRNGGGRWRSAGMPRRCPRWTETGSESFGASSRKRSSKRADESCGWTKEVEAEGSGGGGEA